MNIFLSADPIYGLGLEGCTLAFGAVRELGYGLTELARHLGITQPAVGYAVKRGEHIAKQNGYRLLE